MKDFLEIFCELDVRKEKIVACILTGSLRKPTHPEIREFTILIPDMIALAGLDRFTKLPSCCHEKHRHLLDAHL